MFAYKFCILFLVQRPIIIIAAYLANELNFWVW